MKHQQELNFQEILQEATPVYTRPDANPGCPLDEVLFAFVQHDQPEEEYRWTAAHVARCERCCQKVRNMRTDQKEWEQTLDEVYEEMLTEIPDDTGLGDKRTDLHQFLAAELWPEGTGMALTAATTSITKERSFHVQDGTINIVCNWGKATETDPSYIMLRWEGDLPKDAQFRIVFIHRETKNVLYEIPPDKIQNLRESDRTFTSERLGFDPLQEEWALIVM